MFKDFLSEDEAKKQEGRKIASNAPSAKAGGTLYEQLQKNKEKDLEELERKENLECRNLLFVVFPCKKTLILGYKVIEKDEDDKRYLEELELEKMREELIETAKEKKMLADFYAQQSNMRQQVPDAFEFLASLGKKKSVEVDTPLLSTTAEQKKRKKEEKEFVVKVVPKKKKQEGSKRVDEKSGLSSLLDY